MLRQGQDASAAPDADGGVTAPPSAPQRVVNDEEAPPLVGPALPPSSPDKGTNVAPRRSTRTRVPAPSREDTNDGLIRGGATARALLEVHEAASRHTAALVEAKGSSTVRGAGGVPDVEATSQEEAFLEMVDEIAFLVDVEDPDAPDWSDALNSADRDKWLEGAKAELTSLREMEVYQLIPRSSFRRIAVSCAASLSAG